MPTAGALGKVWCCAMVGRSDTIRPQRSPSRLDRVRNAQRNPDSEKFTNPKILNEEFSRGELVGMMRQFAGALDVRCNHCHVGQAISAGAVHDLAIEIDPGDDWAKKMLARMEKSE